MSLWLTCSCEHSVSAFPTCEPLTQFSCSSGRCISAQWRCDSGDTARLARQTLALCGVLRGSRCFKRPFLRAYRWRLRGRQRRSGLRPVLRQHPVPVRQRPLHPGPLGLRRWQRLWGLQRRKHHLQGRIGMWERPALAHRRAANGDIREKMKWVKGKTNTGAVSLSPARRIRIVGFKAERQKGKCAFSRCSWQITEQQVLDGSLVTGSKTFTNLCCLKQVWSDPHDSIYISLFAEIK